MDIFNLIRAGIFLVAGLLVILFPRTLLKFQVRILKKLRIKHDVEKGLKSYPNVGVLFIIISIIFLIFSIIN